MADGLSIVLRDEASGFAEACVDLLSDLAKCRRIGEQARRCVLESYERASVVVDEITDHLRRAAGRGTAATAVQEGVPVL